MTRGRLLALAILVAATPLAYAQVDVLTNAQTAAGANHQAPAPPQRLAGIPDYGGVRTEVHGIWLTPVANSPFSASVDILTHEKLPDGTERIRTTTNHIARSASGRIYNERRLLVPATFKGLPPVLSAHTYDPGSHLSVVLEPREHLAKQVILAHPNPVIPGFAPLKVNPNPGPNRTEEEIGSQVFQGFTLQGIRKTHTVAAAASDTGQPLVVTDEYWFSPELSIYMIIKHNDPRTGEQLVTVSKVERAEPDPAVFAIPATFKVVDETPPDQAPFVPPPAQ
jgi:hypothetical protein